MGFPWLSAMRISESATSLKCFKGKLRVFRIRRCLLARRIWCIADQRLQVNRWSPRYYCCCVWWKPKLKAKSRLFCSSLLYKSIVSEKSFFLQQILQPHFVVKAYSSDTSNSISGTKKTNLAVCTIEKASAILNFLINSSQEHRLVAVVFDEIHTACNRFPGKVCFVLYHIFFSLFHEV